MNKKIKVFLVFFLLLTIPTLKLYADGECNTFIDGDTQGCPLDSWVYVLVFSAVTLVSYHLYRKQKARPV